MVPAEAGVDADQVVQIHAHLVLDHVQLNVQIIVSAVAEVNATTPVQADAVHVTDAQVPAEIIHAQTTAEQGVLRHVTHPTAVVVGGQ